MELSIYLLLNCLHYFFLLTQLLFLNVFLNLEGVQRISDIASNGILRHPNITSGVNFHLPIHYILLNNLVWMINVAGFVY